jgi:hypothetical protein
LLQNYNPKIDIYDNFVCLEDNTKLKSSQIFKEVMQVGIKKGGGDNAYFKKTSLLLEKDFKFAFYFDVDFELKNSIVTLGADKSSFKLEVLKDSSLLEYKDKNGYLTLLSDALVTLPMREHCEFAITSELSYKNLTSMKGVQKNKQTKLNSFQKSEQIFLYEKGSVFIGASSKFIENLNNKNLQQIGYNIHTSGKK